MICWPLLYLFVARPGFRAVDRLAEAEQAATRQADQQRRINRQLEAEITARKRTESELRKLTQAVEQSPVSIVITDTAGRIEYVNPKFTKVTGYTAEEAIGQNPRFLKSGRTSAEEYRQLWHTITSGEEWRGQFENKTKSGKTYWEQASISPIRDTSGTITHFLAVKEDVTASKRMHDALEESEHRLRTIIDTSMDAIITVDQRCLITQFNPAAESMFGWSASEMIGRPVDRLVPEPYRSQHRHHQETFFQSGASHGAIGRTVELPALRRDGSEFSIELSLAAAMQGPDQFVVGVIRDITARKQADESLHESKQMLENITQGITASIMLLSDDLRILWANQAARQQTGLDNAELLGCHCYQATHHRDTPCATSHDTCPVAEVRKTGKPATATHTHFDKDGKELYVNVTLYPIRNDRGEIHQFVDVCEDVTERKKTEDALRNSEQQYRGLFETSSDAIVLLNAGGFIDCNPAALAMYGCADVDELTALHPADLSPPNQPDGLDSRTAANRKIAQAFAQGKNQFEWVHRRRNGEDFFAEVWLTALELQGQPVLQGTVRDLTARRKAEHAELERKSLQSAVQAMEQVLGVVGHELRTPLAGIAITSELLMADDAQQTPEFPAFLKSINDEVVRMSELVNNLLEAARINSGSVRWSWGDVDFSAAIAAAEQTTDLLIDHDHVAMQFDATEAPAPMCGDQNAIERLIINLVSNSAKHTSEGIITVRICEQACDDKQWALVEVTDTGEGIPENVIDKLGKPFVLNSGIIGTDYIKGSGLGLSICKGIVEAHGGTLHVHSEPGHGTTFTAWLRTDLPAAASSIPVNDIVLEPAA